MAKTIEQEINEINNQIHDIEAVSTNFKFLQKKVDALKELGIDAGFQMQSSLYFAAAANLRVAQYLRNEKRKLVKRSKSNVSK